MEKQTLRYGEILHLIDYKHYQLAVRLEVAKNKLHCFPISRADFIDMANAVGYVDTEFYAEVEEEFIYLTKEG